MCIEDEKEGDEMREIKLRYTCLRDNGYTFSQIFTIGEIEQGDAARWIRGNFVGMFHLQRDLYTGLKDKNGAEGYHKDICQDTLTQSTFVIEWIEDKGRFQLMPIELPQTFHYIREVECLADMELVGNIYENPELLGVKDKVSNK